MPFHAEMKINYSLNMLEKDEYHYVKNMSKELRIPFCFQHFDYPNPKVENTDAVSIIWVRFGGCYMTIRHYLGNVVFASCVNHNR